jgi:mannitol-specific phosphotransferase system IIBC component
LSDNVSIDGKSITSVVVACDAGMGSSVMLTSQLKKRLKKYGVDVAHSAVAQIPAGAQVVVCHAGLAARARATAPQAVVVPFQVFLGDPAFDRVEAAIRDGGTLGG